MFQVLMESGARSGMRPSRWTAASVAAHATLIVGAVAATTHGALVSGEKIRPLPPLVFIQPVAPEPMPVSTQATGGTLTLPTAPTITVPSIPRIDPIGTQTLSITPTEVLGTALIAPTRGDAVGGIPSGGVYDKRLVDHPVIARAENGSPEYPAQLRTSGGLEGDVTVRFVVDSTGRVEPGSIAILTSTHALFSEAVRRWLLRTRYTPADVAGGPVRQLVEQRVSFTLRR